MRDRYAHGPGELRNEWCRGRGSGSEQEFHLSCGNELELFCQLGSQVLLAELDQLMISPS